MQKKNSLLKSKLVLKKELVQHLSAISLNAVKGGLIGGEVSKGSCKNCA